MLDVAEGERWILEPGVYWASEGGVELGLVPRAVLGEPLGRRRLLRLEDHGRGRGRVAINAPGPVETVDIGDGELRVQGRLVLGRTAGLGFASQRSAPFPRNLISGQRRLRVFAGTGKALVCWTPYWNEHMYQLMTGAEHRGFALRVGRPLTSPRAGRICAPARGAGGAGGGEAFIEVDHGPDGTPGALRAAAAIVVTAREPGEVPAALAALDRRSPAAPGSPAMPATSSAMPSSRGSRRCCRADRRLPLLDFGVFPDGAGPRAAGARRAARSAPFRPAWSRADYRAGLRRASPTTSRAGDIYQANLTFPLRGRWQGDPAAIAGGARRARSRSATARWWRSPARRSSRARPSSSSRSTAPAASRRGR